MQDAAMLACGYVEGLGKVDFLDDKRTQQAVILNLVIIGEAATKLIAGYPDFVEAHPDIPWRAMRGMRNRIAHGYFDINLDVVWETVVTDLPLLVGKLDPAVLGFSLKGSAGEEITESKFTLRRVSGAPVSTDELIADLRQVAAELETEVLSQRLYGETGKYDPSTVARRFGTWNKALASAGLTPANEINYPDTVLFENIMRLWEYYGRQPRRAELAVQPSEISQGPYKRRFRSWMDALSQFVQYANSEERIPPENDQPTLVRRGPRDPSLRLRFRVMKRDNFTCLACGASPARSPGLHLHVDHVIPWSAGGETSEDNLQTLCERCNLGKSNVL